MKSRNWIVVVFFIFLFGNANSQTFEYGKVSKAELEEKAHPLEPDAVAAVLFEQGETYMMYSENDGFVMITDTSVRIKIYSKDGYEWANKSVQYYTAQNPVESVSFTKAVTYNLVNGSIEKTKLKSEGEFNEKINKFWSVKKITMPNVKEGSVIEYKYSVKSPYMSTFPTWTFQSSIPVNYSKFTTKIPEYYTYNSSQRGYIFPKVERTSTTTTHTITTKERSDDKVQNVEQTTFTNSTLEYKENIVIYTAQNMPSMKEEDYVNNINNYTSSIEHELSMTKFPNSGIKNYSTNWDDVVQTIYNSESFGVELKKNNYFEQDLTPILATLSTKEEKIAAIYNYVKTGMNWNGFYGYTCDDGVKKAYNSKVGNVAEINLMLTAMLRFAGIEASPVLISTRSNGISLFANRTAFNYVIAAVEIPNGLIYLDATDKFALPNILPIRALNWTGRLVRENGSSTTVDLMPKSNSKEIVNMVATLDSEGKLKGMIRDQFFDYNAFVYRSNYRNVSQESYLEKLEQRHNGIDVSEYKKTDDDLTKPAVESYTFSHNAAADVIDDKIYFSPLLFFRNEINPFKDETREYPVDFVFPHQDKYAFTINIPEGYAVESIPQPISLKMGENFGSFVFIISATDKQVQIVTTLDINEAIISPQEYETLKSFYKQMIEKQNEKVVLKKV